MKTKTIFAAFFLGLVFFTNAQSTEPVGIKIPNSEAASINGAIEDTASQQTKVADGDIDKWRGNDKPRPKAATINGATDDSAKPQPAKAADGDIDKWRGTDKPKPKAATINDATDDTTNPQPAKANINRSRCNIKQQ